MFQKTFSFFYVEHASLSITHLAPIFKYFRFFNLTPNYIFKQQKTAHQHGFLLLGCLIFFINCSLTLMSESEAFYGTKGSLVTRIALRILLAGQLLFYIFMVLSTWFNVETWEKFLKRAMEIDSVKWVPTESKKTIFIFNRMFQLIILQVLLIWFTFLDYKVSRDAVQNYYLILIPTWTYFYHEVFTVFLALTILQYFKSILRDMKETLLNHHVVTAKMISNTNQIYLKLAHVVDLFNDLFGKPLLILLVLSLTQTLILWYSAYINMNPKFQNGQVYGIIMFWIILIFVVHFVLTYCCDLVERESESLLMACYTVQEKFSSSSEEHKNLEALASKITNKKINFTAANFFKLNRTTVFALSFDITTYFIALVQFDQDHSKQT